MDDTEKLKKVLTTTTSALARGAMDQPPILKSWIQTLFEGRAAQDRADSAWKKQEYERKWTFWDSMNGWRLEKARQRTRTAGQASIGVCKELESLDRTREEALALRAKMGVKELSWAVDDGMTEA